MYRSTQNSCSCLPSDIVVTGRVVPLRLQCFLRYVQETILFETCMCCLCSDTTKLEMAQQTLAKENRELKKDNVSPGDTPKLC